MSMTGTKMPGSSVVAGGFLSGSGVTACALQVGRSAMTASTEGWRLSSDIGVSMCMAFCISRPTPDIYCILRYIDSLCNVHGHSYSP